MYSKLLIEFTILQADAVFPGSPEILGWLGSHARSSGDPSGAIQYYRRAAMLSPGHVNILQSINLTFLSYFI